MAATALTDINFQSEVFATVAEAEFTDKLGFLTAGVLTEAPDSVRTTGLTAAMPKWNTLTGDTDVIETALTTTVNSITDVKDIAVWVEREKAWGAEDIIKTISGRDATTEIARQLGQFAAIKLHQTAMSVRAGVFGTALATTHSTGATYAGADIDITPALAAKQLLGDNSDELSVFLSHSKVNTDIVKKGLMTYDTDSRDIYRGGKVPFFLGARTVVTDKLTATANVYPSYFAAPGSLVYKFRPRPDQQYNNKETFSINAGGIVFDVELARKPFESGGIDVLIMRMSYMAHLPGVKWSDSGTNPTEAELATAGNWTKVYNDDKLIKMVEIKTT